MTKTVHIDVFTHEAIQNISATYRVPFKALVDVALKKFAAEVKEDPAAIFTILKQYDFAHDKPTMKSMVDAAFMNAREIGKNDFVSSPVLCALLKVKFPALKLLMVEFGYKHVPLHKDSLEMVWRKK